MLKKLFLSAMLCTASMVAMAQSQIITHVVQRGETLESIAKYYNISVADLNNANPNADGIIYVGMKLAVPVAATSTTTTVATTPIAATETTSAPADATGVNQESESQRTVSSTQATYSFTESKIGTFEPSIESGVTIGQFFGDGAKLEDEHIYKLTIGMQIAFGAKYFITEKLFAEALIGYRYLDAIKNKKLLELVLGDGAHGDLLTHSIYIPLYFGAKVNNFKFKVGPYFDYIVKGKNVTERAIGHFKSTIKIDDGRFSVGLNFCAAISGFGVKFNVGLSKYADIKDTKEMAFGVFMVF